MYGEPAHQLILFRRRNRRLPQRRTIGHLLLPAPARDPPPRHEHRARDQAVRDVLDLRP